VIIVLVGILATTVAVKYGSYASNANLRTAIDQVAADLRFLQCRTMGTMAYTLGSYTNTVSFPVGGTTYYLGGQVKSLPPGVTIQSGAPVTFNSLGEYNTTTDAILILNARGMTGSIKIYAISGDVEGY
jgi:hypothetical protein